MSAETCFLVPSLKRMCRAIGSRFSSKWLTSISLNQLWRNFWHSFLNVSTRNFSDKWIKPLTEDERKSFQNDRKKCFLSVHCSFRWFSPWTADKWISKSLEFDRPRPSVLRRLHRWLNFHRARPRKTLWESATLRRELFCSRRKRHLEKNKLNFVRSNKKQIHFVFVSTLFERRKIRSDCWNNFRWNLLPTLKSNFSLRQSFYLNQEARNDFIH